MLSTLYMNVYHEILINETGVMRGNTPILEGLRVGDNIYYYTGFTGRTVTSTPRRGLDFTLLAYSIINGLRRTFCGYDPEYPSHWNDKCKCIDSIYNGIKHKLEVKPRSLKELLVHIVLQLIDLGLIKPIPSTGISKDTITPKHFITKNTGISSIKDDVGLYSLAVAHTLSSFFNADCPNYNKWTINDVLEAEEEILKNIGISDIAGDSSVELQFYYKTTHGELFRTLANASSLPGYIANFEARVLPFLVEPPPPRADSSTISRKPIEELKGSLTAFFDSYEIENAEDIADAIIKGLKQVGYTHLNPYQLKYLKLAFEEGLDNTLIILTSPTGSGKTLVFTLIAIAAAIAGKLTGNPQRTVITYPRKSLAREQLERLIELVYYINKELLNLSSKTGLQIKVRIAIRDGDSLTTNDIGKVLPLRGVFVRDPNGNKLAVCHGVNRGDMNYFVELRDDNCESQPVEPVDWISDVKETVAVSHINSFDILITNNSMLSKLSFDLFSHSHWLSWFGKLKLLVIDEAHVFMDPAEMQKIFLTITRLIWSLSRSGSRYETIEEYVRNTELSVILSSATLTESELFRAEDGKRIYSQNIVGILRSPVCRNDTYVHIPGEIREFAKKLLSKGFYNALKSNIIYRDYYKEVICSEPRKDVNYLKGLLKLNIYAVTFPSPERSSWTSLAESMVAVLHWINSLRKITGLEKAVSVVFIDNKESQKHIMKVFARRQIIEAADHADRVLMSVLYPYDATGRERKGYKVIWKELTAVPGRTLFESAWDIGRGALFFSTFHGMGLYHSLSALKNMTKIRVTNNNIVMRNVFVKSFSYITDFIKGLTEYAEIFQRHQGTSKPVKAIDSALNKGNIPIGFMVHNADIDERDRAESYIRDGVPYLIMTTSTLEVGIDIPYAVVVLQYASSPTTAELIQRFGRSGRGPESLYVTTGVLVLRNTGEDIHYLDDGNAVDYVFGLKFPALPEVETDLNALVRNVISIIINAGLGTSFMNTTKEMIENYLKFLGIKDETILQEAADLADQAIIFIRQIRSSLNNFTNLSCRKAVKNFLEKRSNLHDVYTLYLEGNLSILRNDTDRRVYNMIKDFVNLSETLYASQSKHNLSIAIYILERLTIILRELRQYLRNSESGDKQIVIEKFFHAANEMSKSLREMIIKSIYSRLESSDLSMDARKQLISSFIHRISEPGVLDELGNVSEDYRLLKYLRHSELKESSSFPFDEFLNLASPAKHKEV